MSIIQCESAMVKELLVSWREIEEIAQYVVRGELNSICCMQMRTSAVSSQLVVNLVKILGSFRVLKYLVDEVKNLE